VEKFDGHVSMREISANPVVRKKMKQEDGREKKEANEGDEKYLVAK